MRISFETNKMTNSNYYNKSNQRNSNPSFGDTEEHWTVPSGAFGDDMYEGSYKKGSWKGTWEGIKYMFQGTKLKEEKLASYYTKEQNLQNVYENYLCKVDGNPQNLPEYLDSQVEKTQKLIAKVEEEYKKFGDVIDNLEDYKNMLKTHIVRRRDALEKLSKRIVEYEVIKAYTKKINNIL